MSTSAAWYVLHHTEPYQRAYTAPTRNHFRPSTSLWNTERIAHPAISQRPASMVGSTGNWAERPKEATGYWLLAIGVWFLVQRSQAAASMP